MANCLGKRLFAVVFVSCVVIACGGEGGLGGLAGGSGGGALGAITCPELAGGAMNANFEADAKANGTIRAFVTASGDLANVAAKVEGEVGAACERMGHDLGVPPEQMAATDGKNKVSAACNAVSAKIDAILKAGVSASIKADVTPPRCEVQANAEASCKGQCNANFDPGYVKAHCEPGHLYGRCEGTCSGTCSGTCNGECQGECQGAAGAKATGAGANGQAAGQCAGTCKGTCKGSCSADCHGNCNIDYKEPKCDIAVKAPSADAHCEGSCKAHAELTAQCTPARVNVQSSVNTGEMPKLIATLQANLPALLQAELAYGKRLGGDIEILVRTGSELPNAVGQLTAHAGACIAAAASACVSAQASISVSVQASASISGKAGAHGGA